MALWGAICADGFGQLVARVILLLLACKNDTPAHIVQDLMIDNTAVRIFSPAHLRYGDHAPVVIQIQGLHPQNEGTLSNPDDLLLLQEGFFVVNFLIPGECDGDICAEGPWDQRGVRTTSALLSIIDALQSGSPILNDLKGADAGNVGLLASSAGGNTALLALAQESTDIAWLVTWESPVGDQFISAELGRHMTNPGYQFYSCGGDMCTVDWQTLAFAPNESFEISNPHDNSPLHLKGTFYMDSNASGTFDPSDFLLSPSPAQLPEGLAYFSTEFAAQLEAFPHPSWLGDLAETTAYWAERDPGVAGMQAVLANHPDLRVMVLGTQSNHVESPADHPEVFTAWNSLQGAHFLRLNPDAAYLSRDGELPACLPASYEAMLGALIPEDIHDSSLRVAAASEMADRTEYQEDAPDLDAPL